MVKEKWTFWDFVYAKERIRITKYLSKLAKMEAEKAKVITNFDVAEKYWHAAHMLGKAANEILISHGTKELDI